jgi:hypothetical protein
MFTDGAGLTDGDMIQLEGQTQTALIMSIDYPANTLTIDRSLTWTNGLGVSLPYVGSAPDMGAYEYGSTEIGRMKDESRNKGQELWMCLPNPIQAGAFREYLKNNRDTKVYDLTGGRISAEALGKVGIYLVQKGDSPAMQKVAIVK